MDVKTFATLLSKELVDRGIPGEIAVKHAVSLVRTFDEEDLREISAYTSASEFEDLSDSLCELIRSKELSGKKAPAPAPVANLPEEDVRVATGTFPRVTKEEPSVPDTATKEIPVIPPKGQTQVPDTATKEIPIVGAVPMGATIEIPVVSQGAPAEVPDTATREIPVITPVPDGATREIPVVGGDNSMATREFKVESEQSDEATRSFSVIKSEEAPSGGNDTTLLIPVVNPSDELPQEIYLDEQNDEKPEKTVLTKRGKAFFWGIAVATSPLTILLALLVLAVFAFGIVAVCAVIAMTFVLVCAEAVLGSGLTLVGIIYGAIEIVQGHPGIGIYEIGLGICCGGLALCLGILTYNLAVLGLPYLLKQLLSFEGYCLKRVGPMLERFREECNRL